MRALLALILMTASTAFAEYPADGDVAGWKAWGMAHKSIYPTPEDGHKPFNLVFYATQSEVHAACGSDKVNYGPMVKDTAGRMVRRGLGACAFTDHSGCTIHMKDDAGRVHLSHEMAHCDGTYNHGGIPFKQLWAHMTGNRKLIDGQVHLYGKPAS
jgi:hypothetical protein